MKIPTIIGKKNHIGSDRRLKLAAVAVLAIAIIAAGSWLAYQNLREDKATFPPGYANREQAYDFVSLWGTYNYRSFGQRAQDLKSQMTPEYYQETFGGGLLGQKHGQVGESGLSYVTVPVDSLNEIKLSNETDNGFDATIYAEEALTTPEGENYYDQITYSLSFVKQDNRFVVNHLSTERSSEQPPHTLAD